jgi:Recombinase/Recombinase zinc beta ribbon domain
VQQVVRRIFQQFEALGTLGGLLRYLARHDIRLGIRVREGPSAGKGQLVWRRPNRMTLQNLLKHPLYAGAYVYGRRQDDPRRKQADHPRSGRVVMRRADWHAFLPDRCPAYISWDQYERNLARLEANRARADAMGAVRDGPALLAGLVICAHCGARLVVHYAQSHQRPAPHAPHTCECTRQRGNNGGPLCQHMPGPCLDTFVGKQVLAALEPAALELSLAAAEQVEHERTVLLQHWQQRRERAAYEAERAARQYHAVEPEHRLVARTLERAWEEKLEVQQQLEEEYHRFLQQQPRGLSDAERTAIRHLAADIPALWQAATTTAADRKELVRQVVERVVVAVQGASEQVQLRIHWVGGGQTEGVLTRPIARFADRSDYAALCERVRTLTTARWSVPAIARQLDADGYAPWRPGRTWTAANVLTLRRQLGLSRYHHRGRSCEALGLDEWWAADLARVLGMTRSLLHTWIQRGLVQARQEGQGLHRWIVQADAVTVERLRQYRQRDIASETRRRWTTSHELSGSLPEEEPHA